MTDVPKKELADRIEGRAPTGTVGLRNFDEGVVETLGAKVIDNNYFIPWEALVIKPVRPAPELPGVPITFSHPEDIYERWRLPVIVVRRDDISPAMQRWHPAMHTYRAPVDGAKRNEILSGDPLNPTITRGFDRYQTQKQAMPFDITYTLSILARHRGHGGSESRARRAPTTGGSPINQVNQLLYYVLRVYQPYSEVLVKDSMGDERSYQATLDAVSHLDEVPEIAERMLGFALTLRVEAELDLQDPLEYYAVFDRLTVMELIE